MDESTDNKNETEATVAKFVTTDSREKGPQGRYIRLDDKLGSGSYKDVWRAYDTNEGREVAWNVVKLSRIPPNERKRIKTEVRLLRDIEHKNVIKYFSSWVDREKEQIIFITEIMSHGSLKDYLRKNPIIRWHAIKRWCRQILQGIEALHTKQIIHRDIKCDNIFINGATGDVRIGDLGLSTRISEERTNFLMNGAFLTQEDKNRQITAAAMTCLGTPEFMAPELYEENYDNKVDIYAFGMTVLEMVTGLMPYHECTSTAQIYRKVLNGILPPELEIIDKLNKKCSSFVKSCLQDKSIRPNATELLAHAFLEANNEEDYVEVRMKISHPTTTTVTTTTTAAGMIENGQVTMNGVLIDSQVRSSYIRHDSMSESNESDSTKTESYGRIKDYINGSVEASMTAAATAATTQMNTSMQQHQPLSIPPLPTLSGIQKPTPRLPDTSDKPSPHMNGIYHVSTDTSEIHYTNRSEDSGNSTIQSDTARGISNSSYVNEIVTARMNALTKSIESHLNDDNAIATTSHSNIPNILTKSPNSNGTLPNITPISSSSSLYEDGVTMSPNRVMMSAKPDTVMTTNVPISANSISNSIPLSNNNNNITIAPIPLHLVGSQTNSRDPSLPTTPSKHHPLNTTRIQDIHVSQGQELIRVNSHPLSFSIPDLSQSHTHSHTHSHTQSSISLQPVVSVLNTMKAEIYVLDVTSPYNQNHDIIKIHLRVIHGEKQLTKETDIEFEYDIFQDNTYAVASEMRECEDLMSIDIDIHTMIEAIDPIVASAKVIITDSTYDRTNTHMDNTMKIVKVLCANSVYNHKSCFKLLRHKYDAVTAIISNKDNNNNNTIKSIEKTALRTSRSAEELLHSNHEDTVNMFKSSSQEVYNTHSSSIDHGFYQLSTSSLQRSGNSAVSMASTSSQPTHESRLSTSAIFSLNNQLPQPLPVSMLTSSNNSNNNMSSMYVSSSSDKLYQRHIHDETTATAAGGGGEVVGDDDEFHLELDEEYLEIIKLSQETITKLEKEYTLRVSTILTQKEKTEETYKKDLEKLNTRKHDLDQQLDSLMEKFKERMDEFATKKDLIQHRLHTPLFTNTTATATAIINESNDIQLLDSVRVSISEDIGDINRNSELYTDDVINNNNNNDNVGNVSSSSGATAGEVLEGINTTSRKAES